MSAVATTMAETSSFVMMFDSTQSSNVKPTMAAGMDPTTTFAQIFHVVRFCCGVFRRENGLSLWKNRMMTAMMAPS